VYRIDLRSQRCVHEQSSWLKCKSLINLKLIARIVEPEVEILQKQCRRKNTFLPGKGRPIQPRAPLPKG
jgi:hypothetical protein